MAGAPSQLDLFDYKPKLDSTDGQPMPGVVHQGRAVRLHQGHAQAARLAATSSRSTGSPARRSRTLLPHLASVADDIAIVRSMHTDQFNHAPAQIFVNTGRRSSAGRAWARGSRTAWAARTRTCPASSCCISGANGPDGGTSLLGQRLPADGLPGRAVPLAGRSGALLCEPAPASMPAAAAATRSTRSRTSTRSQLDGVGDPEIADAHRRVRDGLPDADERARADGHLDRSRRRSIEMYGAEPGKPSFANNCLLARRLVERGVRFVQLYHWGWDHHGDAAGDDIVEHCQALPGDRPGRSARSDQGPQAARPARRHAGRLGRRVRPHADERGARRLEAARPRSSSRTRSRSGWPAAASSRASPSARPTSSATTSSRIRPARRGRRGVSSSCRMTSIACCGITSDRPPRSCRRPRSGHRPTRCRS